MSDNPVFVTRPMLPPLKEFTPYLQEIWERQILTNGGPFHQRLEAVLADYLGVGHLSLFTNGTIALVTALKALQVTGEVITTPYSFVATAHSLLWNGIKPIFVDIDPATMNLDPSRIEEAITPATTAILPVHCYGQPCDTSSIDEIAQKRGLRVIYDAAHAFGVRCHCGSLLEQGDFSVLSFHATKVFNTFEGGAVISPDAATKERVDHLKNFGFVDEVTVVESGINGKMSEIQAAFGLLQLEYVKEAIEQRGRIDAAYRHLLSDVPGLKCVATGDGHTANYSYFPILIGSDFPISRDELYQRMQVRNIFPRRYFYPLITEFPMYRNLPSADPKNLPVASRIAREILCLPIYPGLSEEDVYRVVSAITEIAS